MLLLSETGFGDALDVMAKSDWPAVATVTLAVAVLLLVFGSSMSEATLTTSLITVPAAVPAITFTTTVIVAFAPDASVAAAQVMVVVPEQVHPAGPLAETKDVLAGRPSVKVTLGEAAGPLLVTTCV